ncbi:TldD/PmbA family protein [Nannocystis pusilla]|uniref:TldD/PmbA family protein n=1 Tax=Nannocystis pusilla TaxID=889268 RepID=A0ABS7TI63_9BACT|nr:metallopeptidase TldD-related protein [Nannocystis pusilla]MBZ5707918.1 TldD/PmbA family protein [Nannocystis pusilla]
MSARPAATPAHLRAQAGAAPPDHPGPRARRRPRGLTALVAGLLLTACPPRQTTTSPASDVWGDANSGAAREHAITRTRAPVGLPEPVLDFLAQETLKNLAQLQGDDAEVPAYFLAYDLVARDHLWLEAQDGQIVRNRTDTDRTVDVDVRVGSRQLDNSHPGDANYGPGNGLGSGMFVSVQNDPLALSQALWQYTEQQYKDALAAFSEAESAEQLKSQAEDKPPSPDFSEEKPNIHAEPPVALDLAALSKQWEPRLREVSAALAADPHVLESQVVFLAWVDNRAYVNSENTRIQGSQVRLRLMLQARTQADDGMTLDRFESFEARDPEQLPAQAVLMATAKRLREELLALRVAPLAEPYAGPAVLAGRAAGVFFHEIFGHRLEGHRQKDDFEGQTFANMIGKRVLPVFLDMVDDPTAETLGGVPLSGHYHVDDEGVPAERVVLVERGKLRAFLLGRSPVLPFTKSNGHGRRERGNQAVARQGNLIVTSRKTIPDRELRRALIDEVKRQNKPYGLWFSDIQGGYTITDRSGPQAFKVMPLLVYRVWPDGRPDELVRGVDIVGTPIAAFETIVATGDSPGIFNGMCVAESGEVPVSAVSPSLLLRNLEIERATHERGKPPLLPPPPHAKPEAKTPAPAAAKPKAISSNPGAKDMPLTPARRRPR